jgi:hypothetical protein
MINSEIYGEISRDITSITRILEELLDYFLLIRHGSHTKRRVQQFFYCCVCILYRGNVFTEPLPSNYEYKGIYIQGFMKYAFEMVSDATIYTRSFMKIGSGIENVIGWDTQTQRQHCDRLSLPLYIKN